MNARMDTGLAEMETEEAALERPRRLARERVSAYVQNISGLQFVQATTDE